MEKKPEKPKKNLPEYIEDLGSSMNEILDKTKDLLGITRDEDLANRLYLDVDTIYKWRSGYCAPTKLNANKIRNILKHFSWGDSKCQRDTFIAYNTISYDAVKDTYDQIAAIGDPIALSSAVHSILVKIACLIENCNTADIVKAHHGIPVQKMHSVYGVPDYGEVMNCTYLQRDGKYSPRKVDLLVKIAVINGKGQFVYQLEAITYGKVEQRKGGVICDQSIDNIANTIINYITKDIK